MTAQLPFGVGVAAAGRCDAAVGVRGSGAGLVDCHRLPPSALTVGVGVSVCECVSVSSLLVSVSLLVRLCFALALSLWLHVCVCRSVCVCVVVSLVACRSACVGVCLRLCGCVFDVSRSQTAIYRSSMQPTKQVSSE